MPETACHTRDNEVDQWSQNWKSVATVCATPAVQADFSYPALPSISTPASSAPAAGACRDEQVNDVIGSGVSRGDHHAGQDRLYYECLSDGNSDVRRQANAKPARPALLMPAREAAGGAPDKKMIRFN
jgi:hypothetical protein